MKNAKLAYRYAKALLDLSTSKGKQDSIFKDMELVSSTIKANTALSEVLKSPVIKSDKKTGILEELFKTKTESLTIEFVKLIVSKNREAFLEDIALSYSNAYKAQKGITTAVVTTAIPVDESIKTQIARLLAVDISQLELVEHIDPSIIGGFIVKVGDKQIDTTVKTKLLNLKHQFGAHYYESKS